MPVDSKEIEAEAWSQIEVEGVGVFSEEQMEEFKEVRENNVMCYLNRLN